MWTDSLAKPASMLYTHIFMAVLPDLSSPRQKWLSDIPDVDEEDWTNMWDIVLKQLVSIEDRLVQFNITHRAYYTPIGFTDSIALSSLLEMRPYNA